MLIIVYALLAEAIGIVPTEGWHFPPVLKELKKLGLGYTIDIAVEYKVRRWKLIVHHHS